MSAAASPEPPGGLLARTAKGAGWMLAWRLVTRLLGLVSTLILARLLAPADFGLVALAFTFAATLEAAFAIGLEVQIARARETSRALYDTAFTMSVIRGVTLAILVAAVAAPAAAWLDEPRLEAVVLVLALVPLIGAFGNIGVAEYFRALDFGREFRLLLFPRLLQVAFTIPAAAILQDHWALVLGILVGRIAGTVMSYLMHPYRPRLSLALWRELIGFSFWTWLLSVASVVRDRADSLVIARVLGIHKVGLYTISNELAALPASEIVNPITRATAAGFAAALRGEGEAGDAFLRVLSLSLLLALPACVGLSLVAGSLVAVALGQGWREAAPLLAALALAYFFVCGGMLAHSLLFAKAHLRTLIAVTLGAGFTRILLLLGLTDWLGLLGIAIAICVAVAIEQAVLVGLALRSVAAPARELGRRLWRGIAATAVMAGSLWALGLGWAPAPDATVTAALHLFGGAAVGAALFTLALTAAWLAAGRPPGPEADLLEAARRALGAIRARGAARGATP